MVLKRIFLILILPIFIYAQWTDPRPRSIQLWHLNTTFFDSLGNVVQDSLELLSADGVTIVNNGTLGQNVFDDTTDMKAASGVAGNKVMLVDGRTFVSVDSAYPEGLFAFDNGTAGQQWILEGLVNKHILYAADYGVVANDSTYSASNTDIINALALESYTGSNKATKSGLLLLPAGTVWVEPAVGKNYCINTQTSFIFSGVGSSFQDNGTMLKLRAGQVSAGDTVVVVVNLPGSMKWDGDDGWSITWVFGTALRDLSIDANGNNQDGYAAGLDFLQPGESTDVSNILIRNFKGWGMRVTGSAPPLNLNSLSVFPATGADSTSDYTISPRKGLWLDDFGGVNATSVSGDACRPLLYIGTGGYGAARSNSVINGLKFESGGATKPGYSVSIPIVLDTVSYIGSGLTINNLVADKGSGIAGQSDNVILVRGSNTTSHKPRIDVKNSQVSGFDNLLKWTISSEVDSLGNIAGIGAASPIGTNVVWGGGFRWDAAPVVKQYGHGFYYQNQNHKTKHSLYITTDNKFHIVAPSRSIVLEDSAGTDWVDMTNTNFNVKQTLISSSQFNIESPWLIKIQSTPSNPPTGYIYSWLDTTGGVYKYLVKFPNGDVDTLATSN